jgi:hypothetical protein
MVSQRGSNVNGSGPPGNVLLADPVPGRRGAARTAALLQRGHRLLRPLHPSDGPSPQVPIPVSRSGADPPLHRAARQGGCSQGCSRGEHDQGEYRIPSPRRRRSRAVTWGVAGGSRRRGSKPDLSAWIDVAPRVVRGDQLDPVQPADLGGKHRQQAGGNAPHPGTRPRLGRGSLTV